MKTKPFKTLLELREQESDAAWVNFQLLQQHLQQLQAKHQQLQQYREDYLGQLDEMGQKGALVSRLRNRLDFIVQLDQGLGQLGQQIAGIAKQRYQAEQLWLAAKCAQQSVCKLIERHNYDEDRRENRRNQKENDEFALNLWYSKSKCVK